MPCGRASGFALALMLAPAAAGCGTAKPHAERAVASRTAPTVTPVAARAVASHRRTYATVDEAVADIGRRLTIPVSVPAGLPAGTRPGLAIVDRDRAQLSLAIGGRRRHSLTIEYGHAGFDGCGPLHPRAVRVGAKPGVIDSDGQVATVVWPATLAHLNGRYALSGPFSARQLLVWARSMERAPRRARAAVRAGC